jgi:hypothetical protein
MYTEPDRLTECIIPNQKIQCGKMNGPQKTWVLFKHTNMSVRSTRRQEKLTGAEKVFKELMAEKFPSLLKSIHLYIQEAQQILSRINTKDHMQT